MLVYTIAGIFDRQPGILLQLLARVVLYFPFLLLGLQCVGTSPTGEAERVRGNAGVPAPTSTLGLTPSEGAQKAWWWHTAERAELTAVPIDKIENWGQTWPQHTVTPSIPSLGAALSSKYSQEGWGLFTPHILEPTVMDEAASLETRISSMWHLTPGWTQLGLPQGPITSQHPPHPRYRTLNSISCQWPPKRLADTTHIPFINHNSKFPGHTFTVNGTLSVATCAFGYPKGDHCQTPTPTSETHFRLLNNERDPERPWEPAYPRPTRESFAGTLRGTKKNSSSSPSSSKPSRLSNGNNEKDSASPKVMVTGRAAVGPQNPKTAPYQWTTHADPAEWYRTNWYWEYLDLTTRTMVNSPIDQEALLQVQSPPNTLEAPFVLVPRPIEQPLGGDWREYCYSTLVERYPMAAIFELVNGVLEDYDGNRWELIHDLEEHLERPCLKRVPLTQKWPPDGAVHPEKPWDLFEAAWMRLNGELEFWVCPNLGERETIGIGHAGWSTRLSLFRSL